MNLGVHERDRRQPGEAQLSGKKVINNERSNATRKVHSATERSLAIAMPEPSDHAKASNWIIRIGDRRPAVI